MSRQAIVKDLVYVRDLMRQIIKYHETPLHQGPAFITSHGYGHYSGDKVYLNLGSLYTLTVYRKLMSEMIDSTPGYTREVKLLRHKEAHAYVWALDSLRFRSYVNPYNPQMSELDDGSDSHQLISRYLDLPKADRGPEILTPDEMLARVEALIIQNTYNKSIVEGEVTVSSLNKLLKQSVDPISESKD